MPDKTSDGTVLLSGGNPQIAKGFGDAPVQAYIAAMPGWKSDVGRRIDAIVTRTIPGVSKAVKWNTPFYGVEDGVLVPQLSLLWRNTVKVTFFDGAALKPAPDIRSKYERIRYFHIHENDPLDEARFADWVKQASELPGERL